MVGDVFRVVPYAPDEAGAAAREPGQPEEVDASLTRHPALVPRAAVLAEGVDLEPAELGGVAGRPDDRRDAGGGVVEFAERVGDAPGIRAEDASLRFLGKVEAVACDVGVGLVQQGEVVGVAGRDVVAQVGAESHLAAFVRRRAPDEDHALSGEVTEVDGVTAIGTADRDRDVLGSQRRSGQVPLAENAEPPDVVPAAVAPRRPVMRADREVDLPPGLLQLGRDLDP